MIYARNCSISTPEKVRSQSITSVLQFLNAILGGVRAGSKKKRGFLSNVTFNMWIVQGRPFLLHFTFSQELLLPTPNKQFKIIKNVTLRSVFRRRFHFLVSYIPPPKNFVIYIMLPQPLLYHIRRQHAFLGVRSTGGARAARIAPSKTSFRPF